MISKEGNDISGSTGGVAADDDNAEKTRAII